jgi:hypothetical protein
MRSLLDLLLGIGRSDDDQPALMLILVK